MNGYDLHRMRLNFRFENPDKCRSIHSELFMYVVDLWNRLGQKDKFGLPTHMTMEFLGIGSYNTYNKAYTDLVQWGFIKEIVKSKNQYSARIVAISKTDKATDKALDKATIKATDETTDKATDIIDNNITNKQINNKQEQKLLLFSYFWKLYPNKKGKAKAEEWYLKNITNELHEKIMFGVQAYIDDYEGKKKKDEFAPEYQHGSTFLNKKSWQDYEAIKEDDAWQEAYSKNDANIFANWCKKKLGDQWSFGELGVKYSDLKKQIVEKSWAEVF